MRSWSVEVECVGLQFRWKKTGREFLARKGTFAVVLEREPENEYDPNAIKVLIKQMGELSGKHLGYLKRETAAILAPKLDIGAVAFKSGVCESVDAQHGTASLILRFVDKPARKKLART